MIDAADVRRTMNKPVISVVMVKTVAATTWTGLILFEAHDSPTKSSCYESSLVVSEPTQKKIFPGLVVRLREVKREGAGTIAAKKVQT